jgi:hypothetical protein
MEEKINALYLAFSKLYAENEQLKARVASLERQANIIPLVNETPKISYLANKVIHPYPSSSTDDRPASLAHKIPYFWVSCWSIIFSFLPLSDYEIWKLRLQCKLFRDALKEPPLVATFPSSNNTDLILLVKKIKSAAKSNKVYPKIVLLNQGDHKIRINTNTDNMKKRNYLLVDLPLTFVGYTRETTRIIGGIEVKGSCSSRIPIQFIDLTITQSLGSGVWNTGGLPMKFVRCSFNRNKVMGLDTYLYSKWVLNRCSVVGNGSTGIGAKGASGILINCIVQENGNSGIRAQEESTIHIYGQETDVTKNCDRPSSKQKDRSGLFTSDTSKIFIHEPLHLSCSHGNISGKDFIGDGIEVIP